MSGTLLVTPNAIMFDPNVSDTLVIEHGADMYGKIPIVIMAHFHQRRRTRILIPNPIVTFVLCTTLSTGSDSDLDPCMDTFPNGYCTNFRDESPSQGSESESISVGGNQPLYAEFDIMVCFHCPTPTPRPISVLIPMEFGLMMCRNVYTESMSIPTIPMQMGTVPNLALISVLIRCF